jgi:uncharacterized protein YndB with AHSA1/START domain
VAEIKQSIDIDAPPEQVWAVLSDVERVGEWVAEHQGFPDGAPAELRTGVEYRQTVKAAGQDVDLTWTVVEHEAPTRLAFDGTGPAGASATLRYALAPSGGGTRMDYATSFELPGGAARLDRREGRRAGGGRRPRDARPPQADRGG